MERQAAENIDGGFGGQKLSKRAEVGICEVTEGRGLWRSF